MPVLAGLANVETTEGRGLRIERCGAGSETLRGTCWHSDGHNKPNISSTRGLTLCVFTETSDAMSHVSQRPGQEDRDRSQRDGESDRSFHVSAWDGSGTSRTVPTRGGTHELL